MLLSRYYDNPKENAAFDRCIDVMSKMLQKYGKQVLEQQVEKETVLQINSICEEKFYPMNEAA